MSWLWQYVPESCRSNAGDSQFTHGDILSTGSSSVPILLLLLCCTSLAPRALLSNCPALGCVADGILLRSGSARFASAMRTAEMSVFREERRPRAAATLLGFAEPPFPATATGWFGALNNASVAGRLRSFPSRDGLLCRMCSAVFRFNGT